MQTDNPWLLCADLEAGEHSCSERLEMRRIEDLATSLRSQGALMQFDLIDQLDCKLIYELYRSISLDDWRTRWASEGELMRQLLVCQPEMWRISFGHLRQMSGPKRVVTMQLHCSLLAYQAASMLVRWAESQNRLLSQIDPTLEKRDFLLQFLRVASGCLKALPIDSYAMPEKAPLYLSFEFLDQF